MEPVLDEAYFTLSKKIRPRRFFSGVICFVDDAFAKRDGTSYRTFSNRHTRLAVALCRKCFTVERIVTFSSTKGTSSDVIDSKKDRVSAFASTLLNAQTKGETSRVRDFFSPDLGIKFFSGLFGRIFVTHSTSMSISNRSQRRILTCPFWIPFSLHIV